MFKHTQPYKWFVCRVSGRARGGWKRDRLARLFTKCKCEFPVNWLPGQLFAARQGLRGGQVVRQRVLVPPFVGSSPTLVVTPNRQALAVFTYRRLEVLSSACGTSSQSHVCV